MHCSFRYSVTLSHKLRCLSELCSKGLKKSDAFLYSLAKGTSSSGKTALAKELQTLLDDYFLHVCFDTFYQMLPARFKPTTPADYKYVERVHLGFEYSIPALAKGGNRLIVDYPFHYGDSLPRCLDLISGYTVLYVGVFCPIDVLEQREAARGDRKVGLAGYQSERVHQNSEYDVEVDTHQLSPNQPAQKIASAPETITPPTAFDCLRLKGRAGFTHLGLPTGSIAP